MADGLSDKRIKALQIILREDFGLNFTAEQCQQEGLHIMRITLAKLLRNDMNKNNENSYRTTPSYDGSNGTKKSSGHPPQLHQ